MDTGHAVSTFRLDSRLDCCTVELRDAILTISIDRPAVRNALHPQACAELGSVIDYAEGNDDVRVIVITGSGTSSFSTGFDLQFAEQHPELYENPMFGSELVRRLDRTKPIIAAVNGVALGFGFELALACDLIIAARHASFGFPEPRVGLTAIGGGIVRLTREIGAKRALGMILTANVVSAPEAHRLGFVNEVVDGSSLQAATQRWAEAISLGAPLAIIAAKEVAYRNFDLPNLAAALDPSNYPAAMRVLASEDAREGRRAFLEKRHPEWKGR